MSLVEQVAHGSPCIDAHIITTMLGRVHKASWRLDELKAGDFLSCQSAEIEAHHLAIQWGLVEVVAWALGIVQGGVG